MMIVNLFVGAVAVAALEWIVRAATRMMPGVDTISPLGRLFAALGLEKQAVFTATVSTSTILLLVGIGLFFIWIDLYK